MLPLENFSEEALKVIKTYNINTDDIIMATSLDLDTNGDFGESWLFLTKENLYCLSANTKDFTYKKESARSKQLNDDNITSRFANPKLDTYPLNKVKDPYIDNFTSSNRLFVKIDDQTIGVVYSTNAKKQKLFAFLELMKRIQEGKEVKEDDAIFEQFNITCPKCGRRYQNQNRKICMNCVDKNMLFTRLLKYFDGHVHQLVLILALLVSMSAISLISPWINTKFFIKEILDLANEAEMSQSQDNTDKAETPTETPSDAELATATQAENTEDTTDAALETIDDTSTEHKSFWYGKIGVFIAIIFSMNMLSLAISILNARTVNKMSIWVAQKMKLDIFGAMQKLSLAYFNTNQTGRLMNRIGHDPEVIRGFYTGTVPSFIINVIIFVGVAITMFTINWQLSIIVFIPVPVIIWIFRVKLPQLWRMFSKRWRRSSSLNSMLGDSLTGIRVVKAFAKEVDEANRFRSYSDKLYQADLQVNLTSLSIFPIVNLLMGLTSTIIWGFGGFNVMESRFGEGISILGGKMSYSDLMMFMNYVWMIFAPLQFFTNLTNQITEITNSAQRMFEVIDTQRDIVDVENPERLQDLQGNIEFDNVCFHYLANRPILRNMSFNIKKGDYIGLVGHTGAGKSTIANLITRLYDVISGSIKIDGINIKNIELETLRKNIAIVSQEIFIFRGTIAENIRYAKPDATMDEIINASKAANAHDFIVNLPEGYETFVGTGSRSMSGGEQQRISIARALLLDPKILILDEATAAMDTETERLIQQAINKLVKGRTTIVIAHRLSTLKECNYLFAIENGEIAENGTHIDLINKKGIYYKLYKLQSDAMKRVIEGE